MMPPNSRMDCCSNVAGRSVTIFSIVVISLVMRETISPVRRLTKKLSESVCRCLNSLMRKSVMARFSVRSNK
ncbi:hypothetical protein OAT11_07660 [Nitrospinaceae bacterium]|nr:hypothetical protein [Nitrospinaceae bacterium]